MACKYEDRPTMNFRPSEEAKGCIMQYTEKYESKYARVLVLALDFVFTRYTKEFEAYLESQRKYLNPYLTPSDTAAGEPLAM